MAQRRFLVPLAVIAPGCAVLLAACSTATSGSSTPAIPSDAVSASASPSVTAATSAGASRGALSCQTVFEDVWPSTVRRPESGWSGPECRSTDGQVTVTWLFAGNDPAPEVTDAAYVAMKHEFGEAGWTVSDASASSDDDETETAEMESNSGVVAAVSYVSGGSTPATLSVSFRG